MRATGIGLCAAVLCVQVASAQDAAQQMDGSFCR